MTILIDIHGTPHKYCHGELPIPLHETVAKKIPENNYVLSSASGELFNPLQDDRKKRDKDRGGKYYILRRCSKDCYNLYVVFLRSKNRTHFIIAQRRLLSG